MVSVRYRLYFIGGANCIATFPLVCFIWTIAWQFVFTQVWSTLSYMFITCSLYFWLCVCHTRTIHIIKCFLEKISRLSECLLHETRKQFLTFKYKLKKQKLSSLDGVFIPWQAWKWHVFSLGMIGNRSVYWLVYATLVYVIHKFHTEHFLVTVGEITSFSNKSICLVLLWFNCAYCFFTPRLWFSEYRWTALRDLSLLESVSVTKNRCPAAAASSSSN